MTPQPTDVTEVGLQAYDAVKPLAKEDENNGWALLRFVDALVSQAQTVRDQVRDRSATELGYSILMDVNNAPAYALEWLAQFAGVDLSRLRRAVNILLRNELLNPSFEYDVVATEPFGWEKVATGGAEAVTLAVTEAWAALGKKSVKYKAQKDATATLREFGVGQKLGYKNWVPIAPKQFLNIQAKLNVLQAPGRGFTIFVEWYKADGATRISASTNLELHPGEAGIFRINRSVEAPEHAAFARISIEARTETTKQIVEFYLDELMVSITAAEETGLLEYCDGDQKGCSWVGTPGQSNSIKSVPQTDEQFNELQRAHIKELPATKRGTPAAIVMAAQQYLIGSKTVLMQERPGGNPWRLVILTYSEETSNEKVVKEAIEEQLPAGIVLEYKTVPIAEWIVIRTEYATWKAVKEAFLTWGGVRLNKPGT